MDKNIYVAIEGIDGSGTTTQVLKVSKSLEEIYNDVNIVNTVEPYRDDITYKTIREKINSGYAVENREEMALLFATNRIVHNNKVIVPSLRDGKMILSDRSVYSSLAYQGTGFVDLAWVASINSKIIYPDLVVFLDVPVDVCIERLGKRDVLDSYENGVFLEKVRERYLNILNTTKNSNVVILGEDTIENTTKSIVKLINEIFKI